ncbi:MAG: TetR/AcrR family transcriptional regulator [Acidimicrobiales bacterium]
MRGPAEPESDTGSARRGRPPIGEHRVAVLDATRRLLAEQGYEQMTLEAVAAEAGLYRRYLSRTWGSKAELVRDALFEDVADFRVPDRGALVDDVRDIVVQHVELTLRPEFLRGLPALQEVFRVDRELWTSTVERHIRPPVAAFTQVLGAAHERGEISAHLEPEIVLNTMSGALQQLARLGLMSRAQLVEHGVRLVVDGMVERPV